MVHPPLPADGDSFDTSSYVEDHVQSRILQFLEQNLDGLGGGLDFSDLELDVYGQNDILGELSEDINISGTGDVISYSGA